MKIVPSKRLTNVGFKKGLALSGLFLCLMSCTKPAQRDVERGLAEVEKGHHRTALSYFDQSLKRAPDSPAALEAARHGYRVSFYDLQDYKKSVSYLKHLILNSSDPEERRSAQKQLAGVYFDNINDYEASVQEYSRLVSMNLPFIEMADVRLRLARSYFYMGQYAQSASEVELLLKEKIEPSVRFHALILKGNIFIAEKNFQAASEIFRGLMQTDPARSAEENVPLQLAVCYEENNEYRAAISVLEGLRGKYKPPEYIELRIKRLQERMKNQPGAKGYRK